MQVMSLIFGKQQDIYAVWNRAVYHVLLTLCVVKPPYRVDFLLLHGDVRFIHVEPQQKYLAYLVVQESLSVNYYQGSAMHALCQANEALGTVIDQLYAKMQEQAADPMKMGAVQGQYGQFNSAGT